MRVCIKYFAAIREALGPAESIELPAGATVGQLRDRLVLASSRHAEALGRERAVRMALDQVMCDESAVLADGAEVAFFPPVTGG